MATQPTTADPVARPLRADAARNRELILETAAEVFAEQGLEAGYDEIARRAGVGVGTVYRRFPERGELVAALFESRMAEMVALVEGALAVADPWVGLVQGLEGILERQVTDRGLKEVMIRSVSEDDHFSIGRDRMRPILDRLVERAHRAGVLRPDVETADLGLQLVMIASTSVPDRPDLWRRCLALVLDAVRARPDLVPLPGTAPDDATMHALMRGLHGRTG